MGLFHVERRDVSPATTARRPEPGVTTGVARGSTWNRHGTGDLSARRPADCRPSVPRGTPLTKPKTRGPKSAHLADLRRQLEQHLGTRVDIKVGRKKGAGELRIQFFSLDEFDGLMQRIGFDKNRLPD